MTKQSSLPSWPNKSRVFFWFKSIYIYVFVSENKTTRPVLSFDLKSVLLLNILSLFVCSFVIFRHTQQYFSYMMAVSFYLWKREHRYIIQCICLRDHRPSASKLTNFLTQSHRYKQDSNLHGLEVRRPWWIIHLFFVCADTVNNDLRKPIELIFVGEKKYFSRYNA
jgi:hypothetical protein